MAKGFSEQGEITDIGTDDFSRRAGPDMVTITVRHGKKPAFVKPSTKNPHPSNYDDRRSTRFSVPKAMAGDFIVGKSVTLRITPSEDAKPKKGAKVAKAKRAGTGPIFQAMTGGRGSRG